LFLGQSNGELSLALRNADDSDQVATNPATIRQFRFLQMGPETDDATGAKSGEPATTIPPAPLPDGPVAAVLSPPAARPESFIHTLRGSHVGRVRVAATP
jgi:hypothetical protein